jgi:hypothetical protein
MKHLQITLLSILLAQSELNGQILLNEFCASNQTIIADENGDYSDWIELYNAGASAENIADFKISDNLALPNKFILPPKILAPGEHLRIWASEKDRKSMVHHWETAIFENDQWKYIQPTNTITGWTTNGFDDSGWASGPGGFGFGDGDDNTIVSNTNPVVYMRKSFTVTDLASISELALHIDYDDGFAVWLNGVLVARNNLSASPAFDELASASREATMYVAGGMPEYFKLDDNALVAGTNILCVEVHNNFIGSSDLTCRTFLSMGLIDASTQFSPVPAWFNLSSNLPIHTNFKISNGETIYLSNASGSLVDSKLIPTNLRNDQSFGRSPSGNSNWAFFITPTPGALNTGTSFNSYCTDVITFSKPAGFYSSTQTITLSGPTTIRYTLDGTEPSASSTLYTGPITITSTKVLKAICANAGSFPEKSYVNTYFINESTTLPVWSISTAPSNLFDYNTGIYEMGPNAQTNRPYFGANFWEDWDRPVYVEFFEKDKSRKIAQGADVRIFGNWSRANDMKSLLLMAKNKYGDDQFRYKLYFDKPIDKFEDIALRNSGNDFNVTHYRDGFIQSEISRVTELDYQAYRPSIVFINGNYWGIHNIREKIGADFISENHSISKSEVDLGETWGDSIAGTNNIYYLHAYSQNLDMTNNTNFKFVADSFDIDNMIDYFASQIYISNWDWPQNNLKFWRQNNGDRKFRYILWDTDISLGIYDLQDYNYDQMGRIKNTVGLDRGPHAAIFNNFLKNTAFRNQFINRSADLMNTVFLPTKFRAKAFAYRDSIAPETNRHFGRWPSWIDWSTAVGDMVNFIDNRIGPARDQIESNFNLTKQVTLTLAVQPAGAGIIKINSIYPDTYPWNGVYYDGVPVTITAIPNPGYTFTNWQSPTLIPSANTNKSITLNLSVGETLTAYFSGSSASTNITISEINYSSNPSFNPGDWLELYNFGTAAVDLTGWHLRDNNNYHRFEFPSGTTLAAGARLVIAEDLTKFTTLFPSVSNVIGPLGFGLDNQGERIRLFKPNNQLFQTIPYSFLSPWPIAAAAGGFTLESNSNNNLNIGSNWTTGCPGGSPGAAMTLPCPTSVDDEKPIAYLGVYPNPAKGEFHVRLPENGKWTLTLINNLGIVQHNQILDSSFEEVWIDASDIKSGLYTVVLENDEKRFQTRLVLVR